MLSADKATCSDASVELVVEDPCWFYNLKDPVLMCTVNSMEEFVLWRRDILLIGLDGRPAGEDRTQYNITSYTYNTMRHEKLHIFNNIAMLSIEQHSKFQCESQGHSSPSIFLQIPGI